MAGGWVEQDPGGGGAGKKKPERAWDWAQLVLKELAKN